MQINPINPMNEAELAVEFRRLYKEIGYDGMFQVLYELLVSVQMCCDITREEYQKELKNERR